MDRSTRSTRQLAGGLWYGTLLFILLLVLPASFLGAWQWTALNEERDSAIAQLPEEINDSADRLVEAVKERLNLLVEAEEKRPFWHFRDWFQPISAPTDELTLIASPLSMEALPTGVLGYFSKTRAPEVDDAMQIFLGPNEDEARREELFSFLKKTRGELFLDDSSDQNSPDAKRLMAIFRSKIYSNRTKRSLTHTAINLSSQKDREVLDEHLKSFRDLDDKTLDVDESSYELTSYSDRNGAPYVVATRTILVHPSLEISEDLPECLSSIREIVKIDQGFFLDPHWLFFELPEQIAKTSIQADILFRRKSTFKKMKENVMYKEGDIIHTTRSLSEHLNIYGGSSSIDENTDELVLMAKTRRTERLFKKRRETFLFSMLLLSASLGTGLFLLLRAVREGMYQASRTSNFVAAVGHELRTPITALRLYSEMLTDGWASDEAKREEYHERILRESQRLELLVDRVMQKSRLETAGAQPIATDLQALVDEIVASQIDRTNDISLSMSAPPPSALTDPEGVRSILENLIDNARKYASCSSKSPVEVYVGAQNGQPMLTVSDRGPGVSSEDSALIFDAFYRSGDEERRSAKGIGLGLHLCSLHANAMRAKITVDERPGGGAVFTVLFERASS